MGDVGSSRPGGPWLLLVACGVCAVASVAALGAAAVASAAVVAALAAAMWCGNGGRAAWRLSRVLKSMWPLS